MKTTRFPLPVSHSRTPLILTHRRALALLMLIYATGFFTGAILFGEILLTLHS